MLNSMVDANPLQSPATALAWLLQPAERDVLNDIVPLRQSLRTLAASTIDFNQRQRVIDLAEQRLTPITREINALLCGARQPVPAALRTLALAGRDLHALVAEGCASLQVHPAEAQRTSTQLLRQMKGQLLLSCITNAPLPPSFWEQAIAAHTRLESAALPLRVDGQRAFGIMLAISAVQPESFTPWELILIADVIAPYVELICVERSLPEAGDSWFWLEENGQFPPMQLLRQHYAIRSGAFFFHFETMAAALKRDMADENSPLAHLRSPQHQQVFSRATTAWCETPHRRLPRRRQSYRVDVCTRLGELWQAIQSESAEVGGRSEWMVQNESASGLAIVHIEGDVSGLVTGGVVGLRTMDGAAWKICLVRWLRNPDPSNIEIGLELLAPEVTAVRIVPATDGESTALPALMFTYVDGEQQTPALLVTSHELEGRAFTLLVEKGGQLRISSGLFGQALCRTSAMEIIPYERNELPQ